MRLIPPFLFFVFTFFVVVFPSHAQTLEEILTFKRIGLFEIKDKTRKQLGRKIGAMVQETVEETFRFEIINQSEVIDLPGQPEKILRMSREAGMDLVLAGKVKKVGRSIMLTLALFDGKTGNPFATESDRIKRWKKPDVLDHAVRGLVRKLINRIPYKALVTEVKDERVRFNAGTLHGVEKGLKVSVFEITGVESHPFTHVVVGFQMEEIGQLEVTEASKHSSIATIFRLGRGKKVQMNHKIRFRPSQAALARAEILKKELLSKQQQEQVALEAQTVKTVHEPQSAISTEKVRLSLQTGLFNDTFDFDSNELSFERKANNILSIELQGDVWFATSWGIGLSYRQSGMQFDQIDGDSIDVDATASWIKGGVRYRYFFKKGKIPPHVIATGGYQLYQYQFDRQDQPFFIDYTLEGPFLGFEGRFPLSHLFGLGMGLEYFPLIDYREGAASSGTDSSADGYRIKAGGYYSKWEKIDFSLWYVYERYTAEFSGIGERGNVGITGARSKETYNGFNFNLTTMF